MFYYVLGFIFPVLPFLPYNDDLSMSEYSTLDIEDHCM